LRVPKALLWLLLVLLCLILICLVQLLECILLPAEPVGREGPIESLADDTALIIAPRFPRGNVAAADSVPSSR
jgi:hypothetical protein